MKRYFVFFTALRYFKARRLSWGFISSLLSLIGLTVGLIALITTISVMNGFQLNYINNLLELSSYHAQVSAPDGKPLDERSLERLRSLPEVTAVVPFREFQVIFDRTAERSQTTPGVVRAVDYQACLKDESFIRHLFSEKFGKDDFEKMRADFIIQPPGTVMVGYLLAQYLGVQEDSSIVISSIDEMSLGRAAGPADDALSRQFRVSSIFKSGYRDIDQSYLFMSLENGARFIPAGNRAPLYYGIKFKDRFRDGSLKPAIEKIVARPDTEVKTWRDFNKGYFGALLMEKTAMMFLVGLIFIVVGFNVYSSLRHIVYEKFEEIALLKAIGAAPASIRLIFIFEGLLIGLIGGAVGLLLGLLISMNINSFFNLFTDAVNAIFHGVEQTTSAWGLSVNLGRVESPFSPRVFYFREVTSVVIFEEVLFMFLFAVFSSAAAAFLASKKISEVKPSEVLRYE